MKIRFRIGVLFSIAKWENWYSSGEDPIELDEGLTTYIDKDAIEFDEIANLHGMDESKARYFKEELFKEFKQL